jgi:hypothetical protein
MRLLLWRAESVYNVLNLLTPGMMKPWVKLVRTLLEARRRLTFPHKTARPSMRYYVDLFRTHCFNYRRALLDRRNIYLKTRKG